MRWPPRAVDRMVDAAVERSLRRERCLVEVGPEAERRLLRLDMARSGVYLLAAVGTQWLPNGLSALGFAIIGGMVGAQALKLSQRASAYRSGWLDGRMRFVRQAEHHQRQGNTPGEWMQTEFEHDVVNVIGAQPIGQIVIDIEDEDDGRDDAR